MTSSPTGPQAVVALIKVPWDRTNQEHRLTLRLLDADGAEVLLPGPMSGQPLRFESGVAVGRPPGLAPGTPIDVPFAANLPSLPLAPGRYEWRLQVADEAFSTYFQVNKSLPAG